MGNLNVTVGIISLFCIMAYVDSLDINLGDYLELSSQW
jgi:hypothetical protein